MTIKDEQVVWVERAILGDGPAIEHLYQRYAPAIYRYLFYRLGEKEVAEDLTSEVFVRALEALPRYRQRGYPFSAWLYRIAGARVADYYRRKRRRPAERLHENIRTEQDLPEQEAMLQLQSQALQQALEQLTAAQQQVILLRFVEHLPHAQVAQILGRSEGAVRVLQYRALVALRRILEPEL